MVMAPGAEAYKLEREYNPSERRRRIAKARPVRTTHTRQMVEAAAIAICVLSLLILYVSEHALMAKFNYQICEKKKQLEHLKVENDHLELQIMELSALERVEEIARGKGEMVEPNHIQYVALSPSTGAKAAPKEHVETISLNVSRIAKPAHSSVD